VLRGPEFRFHPDSERLTYFLEMRFSDGEDGDELLVEIVGEGVEKFE